MNLIQGESVHVSNLHTLTKTVNAVLCTPANILEEALKWSWILHCLRLCRSIPAAVATLTLGHSQIRSRCDPNGSLYNDLEL